METLRVVNAVYTMECNSAFDIAWLHYNLMETKYYPARPHMLKWKLPRNGKTVLIFPNCKVQIIGKVSSQEAKDMREDIIKELRQALDEPLLTMTLPVVSTMTLTAQLPFRVNLHGIVCNSEMSYEPELFPAAILSYWKPIKVILFPSGHINITGAKNECDVIPILTSLESINNKGTC